MVSKTIVDCPMGGRPRLMSPDVTDRLLCELLVKLCREQGGCTSLLLFHWLK